MDGLRQGPEAPSILTGMKQSSLVRAARNPDRAVRGAHAHSADDRATSSAELWSNARTISISTAQFAGLSIPTAQRVYETPGNTIVEKVLRAIDLTYGDGKLDKAP